MSDSEVANPSSVVASTADTTEIPWPRVVGAPSLDEAGPPEHAGQKPPAQAPPPSTTGAPGSRRRWLAACGAALVLLIVGAGVAIAVSRNGAGSAAPSHTPTAGSGPPARPGPAGPSLVSLLRDQLTASLIPAQRRVSAHVRGATPTAASYRALEQSGQLLDRRVLQMEGWVATRIPAKPSDRATLRMLGVALAAQQRYAQRLDGLPVARARLTAQEVRTVVSAALVTENAYTRLSGAAPGLPAMQVDAGEVHHLLVFVQAKPKEKRKSKPQLTSAVEVERTIRGHWAAINNGKYPDAYSYFSPRLQSAFARSGWIDDKDRDRPHSTAINITSVSVSGSQAVAYVRFQTRGQETSSGNTGCNAWAGTYRLVETGGRWLLDSSKLVRTSLTC